MSIALSLASSQYLLNTTPPFVNYPFTVGCWGKLNTISNNYRVFGMGDLVSSTNSYQLGLTNTNTWSIGSNVGGVVSESTVGTVVIGSWYYILGRFVSATNRWLSILQPDGQHLHAQNTTSSTNTLTAWSIGALPRNPVNQFWNGNLAEFFITNTDIQPDGAQTQNEVLHKLAFNGPFSLQNIENNISEYHSFRYAPSVFAERSTEDYYGAFGKQTWSIVNGIAQADHPPLSSSYVSPYDRIQTIEV